MADQGEWTLFVDVLASLVFGIILILNVDGLVDLAAIDAFLAYHHSARIVCCTPDLYVWLVSHVFRHESRPVCPLQGHCMCAEKKKANWEEPLAGMVRASVRTVQTGSKANKSDQSRMFYQKFPMDNPNTHQKLTKNH